MRSEFDFIQNIKKRYRLSRVGDDCAVIPKDSVTDLLITADMLAEGIDFHIEWTPPEFLGHKALAVSLSDVAAMGGEARWAMISIAVPEALWNNEFLDRFYAGWHELAVELGVEMIGGDVSRSPVGLFIDSVVGGEVSSGTAVTRSRAMPGDLILVTGTLGGAAGGLRLLEEGVRYSEDLKGWQKKLLRKQLRPWPQLDSAAIITLDNTATAMIDISDGLSSDLAHICEASRVGARLDSNKIPIDPQLKKLGLDESEQLRLALDGGEDFELLFTADPQEISNVDEQLFTVIGEITANDGLIELTEPGGTRVIVPGGYRHF